MTAETTHVADAASEASPTACRRDGRAADPLLRAPQVVWRCPRSQERGYRLRVQRGPRAGGRQRRRQVDPDQDPFRCPPPGFGRHLLSGKARHLLLAARGHGSRHRDDLPVQRARADALHRAQHLHLGREPITARIGRIGNMDFRKMGREAMDALRDVGPASALAPPPRSKSSRAASARASPSPARCTSRPRC